MKINIICVGRLKEAYLLQAQKEYLKRLQPYATIKIIEIADDNNAETLLAKNTQEGYIIALALDGKALSSDDLATKIKNYGIDGKSNISFIIGGSEGISQKILQKCHEKFSLSKLTFPHRLARIIWLEQVYRAFKIIKNEPYHK